MIDNPVKRKIMQGGVAWGITLAWPAPDLIEFYGRLGFEWAFIDAEHGLFGRETVLDLIRACNVVGMVPVVRVPEINRSLILGYLDIGALGIVAPHVNTADDARALVEACRFHPLGKRGANTGRPGEYGFTGMGNDYYRLANDAIIVDALVEEVTGIRNLDEILAVEGLDVVGIGPGDLSHTLGVPGQQSHPEVVRMVAEAEARVVAAGKILDGIAKDMAGARVSIERGARLMAVSLTAMLADAGQSFLSEARQLRAAHPV